LHQYHELNLANVILLPDGKLLLQYLSEINRSAIFRISHNWIWSYI